jgi:adenine phosphoribosyltransferase
MSEQFDFDTVIRKVPDFPKPGILFYDITSVLESPAAMDAVHEEMDRHFPPDSYDALLGVESRGFISSSIAAHKHKKPLYLARKPGKLPNPTVTQAYDLEYGSAALEIQEIDLIKGKGQRWLVTDDLIATGGTLEATCSLLIESGVEIAGIFSMIGLPFLGFGEKLKNFDTVTLIDYHSE